MANRNNGIKSVAKPEFTDYTVAGTDAGRYNAAKLRSAYETRRSLIALGRVMKLTTMNCRTEGDDVRCGFPTKRERDEDIPSHRGVPHSNFLKRFKLVDRITFSKAAGNIVYSTKIWVLHATRGWKLYA